MGCGVLLERVLLPSKGTNQNLKAKLSHRFSELDLVTPKKETILQSLEEVE